MRVRYDTCQRQRCLTEVSNPKHVHKPSKLHYADTYKPHQMSSENLPAGYQTKSNQHPCKLQSQSSLFLWYKSYIYIHVYKLSHINKIFAVFQSINMPRKLEILTLPTELNSILTWTKWLQIIKEADYLSGPMCPPSLPPCFGQGSATLLWSRGLCVSLTHRAMPSRDTQVEQVNGLRQNKEWPTSPPGWGWGVWLALLLCK